MPYPVKPVLGTEHRTPEDTNTGHKLYAFIRTWWFDLTGDYRDGCESKTIKLNTYFVRLNFWYLMIDYDE